jgi:VanZ family protein
MGAIKAMAEFLRERGLRLVWVLAWMGVIFYFSATPHSAELTGRWFGNFNILVRKGGHIAEYAVLTGLLWYFWQPWRTAPLLAALGAVLYAISDEFHQSFVPGRGAYPSDVLIDSLGIVGAWWLLHWRTRNQG